MEITIKIHSKYKLKKERYFIERIKEIIEVK